MRISDFDLNLMKPGQDLYDITSGVLLGLKSVLTQWRPDAVLVHGDTTTTLAAAMAGFYAGIQKRSGCANLNNVISGNSVDNLG